MSRRNWQKLSRHAKSSHTALACLSFAKAQREAQSVSVFVSQCCFCSCCIFEDFQQVCSLEPTRVQLSIALPFTPIVCAANRLMQQCLTACDEVKQQQQQKQRERVQQETRLVVRLSCCVCLLLLPRLPPLTLFVFILQFPRCNFVINFCHDARLEQWESDRRRERGRGRVMAWWEDTTKMALIIKTRCDSAAQPIVTRELFDRPIVMLDLIYLFIVLNLLCSWFYFIYYAHSGIITVLMAQLVAH